MRLAAKMPAAIYFAILAAIVWVRDRARIARAVLAEGKEARGV